MSDFWLMQWVEMRQEVMEKEANRRRLAAQARAERINNRGHRELANTCLFRLGKFFESAGRCLQRRFGPKPSGACCG